MDLKNRRGLRAEKLAGKYLRKQGYRILEERYRTKFGELDLVCRKGRELLFVEVRSIESPSGFRAEESLQPKKIAHIIKSARAWLLKKKLKNFELRFDVITVDLSRMPPEINHYPGAFECNLDL